MPRATACVPAACLGRRCSSAASRRSGGRAAAARLPWAAAVAQRPSKSWLLLILLLLLLPLTPTSAVAAGALSTGAAFTGPQQSQSHWSETWPAADLSSCLTALGWQSAALARCAAQLDPWMRGNRPSCQTCPAACTIMQPCVESRLKPAHPTPLLPPVSFPPFHRALRPLKRARRFCDSCMMHAPFILCCTAALPRPVPLI